MKISLLKATLQVEKTTPCILKKMATWFLVSFAFLASALAGAGIGLIVFAFGIKSSMLATLLALLGVFGCAYFLMKLRGSVFVPLRASYVNVLLSQAEQQQALSNKKQLQLFQKTVKKYFKKGDDLAVLERNIRKVVQTGFEQQLDIKRFSFNNEIIHQLLKIMVAVFSSIVAEPILAYAMTQHPAKAKASSAQALAIYLADIKQQVKTTAWLMAFTYASWAFFVVVLILPVMWLTAMLPFALGFWNVLFAMVLAWSIRAAIFESIAVAAYIPYFLDCCSEQTASEQDLQQVAEFSDGYFKAVPDE